MSAHPLLELKDLSIGVRTLKGFLVVTDEVTMRIDPGETVCLVGESGSGKTITSLSIMRLTDYNGGVIAKGEILWNGQDLAKAGPKELRSLRGNRISMIFQEPMTALDPVFAIGQQLTEIILRHKKVSRKEAWRQGVELLRRVGITEPEIRMRQYPGDLSGGMRQRVMIAIALACNPDLLIADEPTTALDVTIQAQILALLRELKAEYGMSILLITHDLGIAAEMADRVVVMYAGKIVEQADVYRLFKKPYHPYTMGLLKSVTSLESDRSKRLYSIEGSIPNLNEWPSGCRFHPRCPFRTEQCITAEPPLREVDGRLAACWHAEALAAADVWNTGEGMGGAASSVEVSAGEAAEAEDADLPGAGSDREPLMVIERLKKYYKIKQGILGERKIIRAVDDVTFEIRRGETFGLVGESGCGKSTLGRVLLNLEKATEGRVLFEGRDLTAASPKELREARKEMQIIFQDPYSSIDPRWKIGNIIGEPLWVHESMTGKAKREKVQELMRMVGLSPAWYDRYPHEFSGGQRQRVGIARALALQPKFLLCDEPVSALDVSVQAQVINLLQDLQERLHLTYLFIAHGLSVVRHVSDRIGVMYLGKMVEIAKTEELFRHPAHHYTKALLSANPVPDPERRRNAHTPIQGELPSPTRPPSGCRFHTRCPAATERCRQEVPEWREIGKDHFVACHHPA